MAEIIKCDYYSDFSHLNWSLIISNAASDKSFTLGSCGVFSSHGTGKNLFQFKSDYIMVLIFYAGCCIMYSTAYCPLEGTTMIRKLLKVLNKFFPSSVQETMQTYKVFQYFCLTSLLVNTFFVLNHENYQQPVDEENANKL
jgi:hypothetical protein